MYDEEKPALDTDLVALPVPEKLGIEMKVKHKLRIPLLCGSTRERSFIRLISE